MKISTTLRILVSCALLLVSAACAEAQVLKGEHLTVELVSEGASIQPGRAFTVGLLFKMEKDWHIYWHNPGDSGSPPSVTWQMPAGFTAGEIQWPYPRRLPVESLMDFGYADEVLLMTTIELPADLKPGRSIPLKANVKWVTCRDVCLSGKGDVSLTLPIAAEPPKSSPNQPLFAATRERLPRPADPLWKVQAYAFRDEIVLAGAAQLKEAEFFPDEPLVVENAALQELSRTMKGFELELKKSDQSSTAVCVLKGVLVADRTAYALSVPVQSGDGHCKTEVKN